MRAFCSLSLGVLVYNASVLPSQKSFSKFTKAALTALEIGCAAAVLLLSMRNLHVRFLIKVIFIVMLSGQSAAAGIHGKFFDYLGGLSLIMYLFHWPVGLILNNIKNNSVIYKYALYLCGVAAVSNVIFLIGKAIGNVFVLNQSKREVK